MTVPNALFSLIISSVFAEPANTLSLQGAFELAKQSSPDLRQAELTVSSAKWGELEALSAHLPHLSANATYFFAENFANLTVNFGGPFSFPNALPQTNIIIEASLMVFDGLASINNYRASLLEHEAADLRLSFARLALEEGVQTRFNQALAAQELVKVSEQNIETLENHLKLARASQQAGYSTKVDVLRIEAQLEEAQADRLNAIDDVTTARHALNEVMGISQDNRALEGTVPVPDARKVPEDLALDISKRDDVQAVLKSEDAQDKKQLAAKGFWFPSVTIFGDEQLYQFNNFGNPLIISDASLKNASSFGIRATWNLFDGGASIARSAQATREAEKAAQEARKAEISAPNDFDSSKRRYIYNATLYEARKRAVDKSAESVRLATLGVQAGTKTNAETLDAENELFRARAGVIRAQLDASDSLAKLELALGHRL